MLHKCLISNTFHNKIEGQILHGLRLSRWIYQYIQQSQPTVIQLTTFVPVPDSSNHDHILI